MIASMIASIFIHIIVALADQRTIAAIDRSGEVRIASAAALPDLAHVKRVWSWTQRTVPTAFAPDDVARDPQVLATGDAGDRCTIVIQSRERGGVLIAAPESMWLDVPEDLLPHWTIGADNSAQIPISRSEPTRTRFIGRSEGSWWMTIRPRTQRAVLTASPALTRSVRVIDRSTRQALDRAVISVTETNAGRAAARPLAMFRAAKNGTVAISSLPELDAIGAVINEPDHAPLTQVGRVSSLPEEVALESGVAIRGSVRDEKKQPLRAARVVIEGWLSDESPAIFREVAQTDAEGAFTLQHVPAMPSLALVMTQRGFARYRTRIVAARETVVLPPITLKIGTAIRFHVTDDLRHAVAGAEVRVADVRYKTDAKGEVVADGLDATESFVAGVSCDGYLPVRESVAPPFPQAVSIQLARSVRVRGRFTAPSGSAIPDAHGELSIASHHAEVLVQTNGSFQCDVPPQTAADLILSSASSAAARVSIEPHQAGDVVDLGDVRATGGRVIRGRVVDALTREPIVNARVWTPRATDQGPLVAWMRGDILESHSDADGVFAVNGLPAGPVVLRVDAASHARAYLETNGDTEDAGELAVTAGGTIIGRGSEHLDGAVMRVDLRGDGADYDLLQAKVIKEIAQIAHVPAGRFRVSFVREHRVVCERDVETTGSGSVDVACSERRTMTSGHVFVGGNPAGGGALMWSRSSAGAQAGGIMTRTTLSGERQQTVVGETSTVSVAVGNDGRYSTDEINEGSWRVIWIPPAGGAAAPQTVSIPDADTFVADFSFAGGIIHGRVVDEKGAAARHALVRELNTASVAPADDEGRFLLTGLAAGSYRVQARLASEKSAVVGVDVKSDSSPEALVLILGTGENQSIGVSVTTGGLPCAEAMVFANFGVTSAIVTSDANGVAHVRLPEEAGNRARFAAVCNGSWALSDWRQLTDASRVDISVPPSGGLRIAAKNVEGPLAIVTSGWDLTALMLRLGIRVQLRDGLPAVVSGLPQGHYDIRLGGHTAAAEVEAGKTTSVRLE